MADLDLNDLRASSKSRSSEWIMMESFANIHDSAILIMTEGQDDTSYYKKQVQRVLKSMDVDKRVVVRPAERGNSYFTSVLSKIRKDSPSYNRMLFFFDREFPVQTKYASDIFLTKYHSIENYFSSVSVFEKILETLPMIDEYPEVSQAAKVIFSKNRKIFIDSFFKMGVIINALFSRNISPNIRKINLDKYFKFNKFGIIQVQPSFSFSKILEDLLRLDRTRIKTISNGTMISILNEYLEANNCIDGITDADKLKFIRGKEDLKFFNMQMDLFKNIEKLRKLNLEYTPEDYLRNTGINGALAGIHGINDLLEHSDLGDFDDNITMYVKKRLSIF